MPEATPQATPGAAINAADGTSPAGQAAQPQAGSQGLPNDPAAFQAEYTKKFTEVAEQRKAVETEKTRLDAEKAAFDAQRRAAYQPSPGYSPTYQQPAAPQVNPLVEQFGQEGAQAIQGLVGQAAQSVYSQMFASEYAREEEKGRSKFGTDAWDKFNYTDPQTGATCNQVMDMRVKGLTVDQAWNALNPVDPAKVEQSVRDKVYAEIKAKGEGTPAPGSGGSPATPGTGQAKSTEEAFRQAQAYHSGK